MRSFTRTKQLLKVIKRILVIYVVYAVVMGVIVFAFYKNNDSLYLARHRVDRFFGDEIGPDRVVLIEDRGYSGVARINLLENAKQTLDISCFTIHNGKSSDIFYGKVLEAADRGVKVRMILDGIFHNFRGSSKDMLYALKSHPNIEFKLYEPFNLWKPWTWNNRLHDKHIIVDNKMVLTGGRNIGDRYFTEMDKEDIVHDRDILIINTKMGEPQNSSVQQIKDYFDRVWDCEYSKESVRNLSKYKKRKAENKKKELEEYIKDVSETHSYIFNTHIDWIRRSVPTNKVTLIYNPIGRFNGEPWVLWELSELIKGARKSILIQSPYVVPNREIMKYIPLDYTEGKEATVLTNSLNTTPNYLGMAGYMRRREDIESFADSLYEYQGMGSIHGKTYIIDNRISLVGSFNIDPRSAFLNTETMVVIDSEEFTEILNNRIDELIDKSLLVGQGNPYQENQSKEEKAPVIKRVIIKILSKITFLFEHLI